MSEKHIFSQEFFAVDRLEKDHPNWSIFEKNAKELLDIKKEINIPVLQKEWIIQAHHRKFDKSLGEFVPTVEVDRNYITPVQEEAILFHRHIDYLLEILTSKYRFKKTPGSSYRSILTPY